MTPWWLFCGVAGPAFGVAYFLVLWWAGHEMADRLKVRKEDQ